MCSKASRWTRIESVTVLDEQANACITAEHRGNAHRRPVKSTSIKGTVVKPASMRGRRSSFPSDICRCPECQDERQVIRPDREAKLQQSANQPRGRVLFSGSISIAGEAVVSAGALSYEGRNGRFPNRYRSSTRLCLDRDAVPVHLHMSTVYARVVKEIS